MGGFNPQNPLGYASAWLHNALALCICFTCTVFMRNTGYRETKKEKIVNWPFIAYNCLYPIKANCLQNKPASHIVRLPESHTLLVL